MVTLEDTKFSTIDLAFVKTSILGIEPDDTEDDLLIQMCINSAKQWIKLYRKETEVELDADQSVNMGYIMLIHEYFTSRGKLSAEEVRDILRFTVGLNRVPNVL